MRVLFIVLSGVGGYSFARVTGLSVFLAVISAVIWVVAGTLVEILHRIASRYSEPKATAVIEEFASDLDWRYLIGRIVPIAVADTGAESGGSGGWTFGETLS